MIIMAFLIERIYNIQLVDLHRFSRRYAALSRRTLVFSIFLEEFDISGTSLESSVIQLFNFSRRCFSARFRLCRLELKIKIHYL
jgi:hypothetical protein